MNKLTIIGNLTRDPELRTTTAGVSVCDFSVAVNRKQTSEQRQQGVKQEADYFRVTAWRDRGEVCAKYLAKGRKVCVIGPVSVRTYTGNDGVTRASLEVTAEEVEFLGSKGDGAPAEQGQNYQPAAQAATVQQAPVQQAPAQQTMQVDPQSGMQVVGFDELPF